MNEITINQALEEILATLQSAPEWDVEQGFRKAIELRPDDADAHYLLGCILFKKGDFSGAEREYKEAIRSNPDFVEAHNNLGYGLCEKGDLEGAVLAYKEAIRLRPDFVEAHIGLGYV